MTVETAPRPSSVTASGGGDQSPNQLAELGRSTSAGTLNDPNEIAQPFSSSLARSQTFNGAPSRSYERLSVASTPDSAEGTVARARTLRAQLHALKQTSSHELLALEEELARDRERIKTESARRLEELRRVQADKKASTDTIKNSWNRKVLESKEKLKIIEKDSLARQKKREEDRELEMKEEWLEKRGRSVARRSRVRNKVDLAVWQSGGGGGKRAGRGRTRKHSNGNSRMAESSKLGKKGFEGTLCARPPSLTVELTEPHIYHAEPESYEDEDAHHGALSGSEGSEASRTPHDSPRTGTRFTLSAGPTTPTHSWRGRALGGLAGAWTASLTAVSASLRREDAKGLNTNDGALVSVRSEDREDVRASRRSSHVGVGSGAPAPVVHAVRQEDGHAGSQRRGGLVGIGASLPYTNRRQSLSHNYFKSLLTTVTAFFNAPASVSPAQAARKAKKYVLQSAEFYGADFSAPSENDELAELEQRRVVHGSVEEGEEQERVRVEQGSVFITAMSSIATRGDDWDKYRDGARGDGGGSRAASRRASVANLAQAGLTAPPNQLGIPAPPPAPALLLDSNKGHVHALDYSEVFPFDTGKSEGLSVFRIESLKPIPLPASDVGTFCVADCYIILHSSLRDGERSPRSDSYDDEYELSHSIFTWIGSKSELDKRFCAAIFSVGLRNSVSSSSTVQHESDHDESPDFLALFHDAITYADASQGTESGLYMPPKRVYPIRMYVVTGQKQVTVQLVEPAWWSLQSDRVMIVDAGMELFVWYGTQSRLQHRAKGRIIAERIGKLERGGRAWVIELDEWQESPLFWEKLGGVRVKEGTGEEPTSPVDTDEATFLQLGAQPPTLYRAFDELSDDITSHTVSEGRLKRGMLVSDGSYVLDAGVELFLWLAEDAEIEVFKLRFPDWEGSSVDINWHEIKLGETGAFNRVVGGASKLRVDVRALYAPPPAAESSATVVEDTIKHANDLLKSFNTFVYERGRFVTLPTEERGHFFVDDAYVFLCVYRLEEQKERELREAREQRRAERRKQRLKIVTATGSGVTSSGTIPSADGTVSASDSGASPATAKPADASELSSAADADSDDDSTPAPPTPTVECVVYFWGGRRAPKLAYSTFKFKTQPELEQLMQDVHKCSVRVVHLEQGKEPIALLAHLDNMWMLHRGSRRAWAERRAGGKETAKETGAGNKSLIYHIRTDERYRTVRAAEMLPKCSALVTRDCIFLLSHLKDVPHYLWIGRGTSKDEIRRAHSIVQKLILFHLGPDAFRNRSVINPSTSIPSSPSSSDLATSSHLPPPTTPATTLITLEPPYKTITEKLEPATFFSLLIPPRTSPALGTEHYYCRPPRFLRCSCSQGYFSVEEVTHFTQMDLKSDMCIILDPGAPRKVFCWIGEEASDVVRKLSRKSVDVWLERLDDGRMVGASGAWMGVGNKGKWNDGGSRASVEGSGEAGGWEDGAELGKDRDDRHKEEESDEEVNQDAGGLGKAREAALKAVAVHARRMSRAGSALGIMGMGDGPAKGGAGIGAGSGAPSRPDSPRLSGATATAKAPMSTEEDEGDVVWIAQGQEPAAFRAFFLGWDELPVVGVRDPGNRFLREQRVRKSKPAAGNGTTLPAEEAAVVSSAPEGEGEQAS
ncbi:hypothetical protein HDV00_012377 [Rhizophlyctis rosea]|nr:hypothetical protein HDV00_012377 [Rhizophlyctis rosea]